MQENTKDLTVGKPIKLIMNFAIPLWFGYLFQQVYNIVDTIIVGKGLGVDAISAVGATGSVCFLIIGFACGVCDGFALPVAQWFGAKNEKQLKKSVGNACVIMVALATLMTVLTVLLCRNILQWMNTPENIFDMTYSYLIVILIGIPGSMLFNFAAALLRAVGNSKVPVYILVLSSALNIILDLLFVIVLKWGVAGAAWATIISQAVSGVCGVAFIVLKIPVLHFAKTDLLLEKETSKRLLWMGLPMGFQYSITAIGTVVIQAAVNELGSIYIAAMSVAIRIQMFAETVITAFSATMATYCGQNVGARKLDRVRRGLLDITLVACIYSVIVGVVFSIWGKYFIMIFVKAKEIEVLEAGATCLTIMGLFFIPLAILNIFRFSIQGMGFSALSLFAGLAELIGRVAVAIIFVPIYGFVAACYASPVAWISACLFLVPAFFWCLRKEA